MPIILPNVPRARSDDPLLEFLREKGPMGALETALCLADWLTRATGRAWVSALEVQALSRRGDVRGLLSPLRCASDTMRSASISGLLILDETADEPDPADPGPRLPLRAVRYRVSALGHAVVAALPDRVLVRSVRRIRRGVGRRSRAV